jgi:hypothetical protein
VGESENHQDQDRDRDRDRDDLLYTKKRGKINCSLQDLAGGVWRIDSPLVGVRLEYKQDGIPVGSHTQKALKLILSAGITSMLRVIASHQQLGFFL